MDISTIKQKIAALEAEIVPNSVSPERVASILSDITSLVENMGYLGYEFLGVATPAASPSFDKDLTSKKYFYIAVQQGTYANFGGLAVGANDGLTILAYNGTWTKTATGTAMKTDITSLQSTVNSLSSTLQTVKSNLETAETDITSLQTSVTNINTKILPLSVSFDLDKIDALTDSSGSTDIKEAFTPLSGIGVAPVAGNILRSGNVIKNSQEVTVIWSDYDSKTAYYSFSYVIDNVLKIFQTDAKTFVRVAKTVVGGDVGAEIEDLQDKVSIGKAPIWITMTLESEPHDPINDNIGDIIFFEEGNYLKEVVRSATGGKTLGQAVDMETGRLYVYGGGLYKWDGSMLTAFLTGPRKYDYDKVMALSTESLAEDIAAAFTPIGGGSVEFPLPGDLLVSTDDRNHSMFLSNTQTTKSNAPVYLQILNMTNAGAVIHVIGIRGGTAVASVYDIELDKEVESSDVVRLTAALEAGDSINIGMSLGDLAEKNPTFIIDKNQRLFYVASINHATAVITGLLLENNGGNMMTSKEFILSDNGDGTVYIKGGNAYNLPKMDSDGKIPAALLPVTFVRPELQIQSGELRIKAPAGALKETDEVWFYRRGKWQMRPSTEDPENPGYNTIVKSGWRRINNIVDPTSPDHQRKVNKSQDVGPVIKLVLEAQFENDTFYVRIDEQEVLGTDADFQDFFEFYFCRFIDEKDSKNRVVYIMTNGKREKKIVADSRTSPKSNPSRIQRWGLAIWRDGKRITPIMEFKVIGYLARFDYETASATDLRISLA